MATTTAMNRWVEELVTSLLPSNTPPSEVRKSKTQFNRGIRYHNFGRTNQFEVEERLTGLEEKFQVLDHDDLSDAIHERRDELRQHFDQWIPDSLDFLLRMSKEPMSSNGVGVLAGVGHDDLVTPQLTWADIERDDPTDRMDRMWRIPHFSDASSDEGVENSSEATSPASTKQPAVAALEELPTPPYQTPESSEALNAFRQGLFDPNQEEVHVTEIQAIRETLFMLQGLPTAIFPHEGRQIKFNRKYKIAHTSSHGLNSVFSQAILISRAAASVRTWTCEAEPPTFVRVLEDQIHAIASDFDASLSSSHAEILKRIKDGGVCSLLATVDAVSRSARPIIAAAEFVSAIKGRGAIDLLDVLFEQVCKFELCDEKSGFESMVRVFSETMRSFTAYIDRWVLEGRLPDQTDWFFVERAPGQEDKAKLWHSWYLFSNSGSRRLPDFLRPFSQRIFVAGKTTAFLNLLLRDPDSTDPVTTSFDPLSGVVEKASAAAIDSLAPFAPSLLAGIEQYINSHLSSCSAALQRTLEKDCNLKDTLFALSHLYLAEAPYATSIIDEQSFEALDRARPSWNDRFLVSDTMEEAFANITCVDLARINVQSEHLPSSTLRQSRQSVKVLENIAVDYTLSWPIANIISTDNIASYRRAALILNQIRRARYVLERHAFPNLLKHANAKISVEGIYANLMLFTNVLYSHLMHCAISPMTLQLRDRMFGTVDEMVALHKSYTTALERVCLAPKSLKVLRETLVSLLDLCVSFGLQVAEAETEIDSFALSKIKTQFRKYMNLLIAGLRGSARAGALPAGSGGAFSSQVGDLMELLADSLTSAGFKM